MKESEFEKALKAKGQKLTNGKKTTQIHISLPEELKDKLQNYCEAHYTTPSAQIRIWIDQYCN